MTRRVTKQLLDMIDKGFLDRDQVILACVNYMSEAEVEDMCHANEFIMNWDSEEEDAEAEAEDIDADAFLDDFNYVGSRHHY